MVKTLHAHHAYPVTALCRLLAVPRSRYYVSRRATYTPVLQTVQAVAAAFLTYGSRRIAARTVCAACQS
jgi:hypothetical protein